MGADRRLTLQTIADALGVSRTTVSNAYNRPDQLAPELRERILAKARELGYAGPDPAARRLRSGRPDAFGLLFTEDLRYALTDPAAALFLQGVADAADGAGMSLLLVTARAADAARQVRDAVVGAFCAYSLPDDHPAVLAVLERGVPLVVADEPRIAGASFLGIDDRAGARAVAAHVAGLGHRRIAIIADRLRPDDYRGPVDAERRRLASFAIWRERLEGIGDALAAAGVSIDDVPIEEREGNVIGLGCDAAEALLERDPRPTALVALTDQLALGALKACRRRGLRVPEDVSVTGFDDVPDAEEQGLTTVRQPLAEKGRVAGELLVEAVAGRPPREIRLPVELVVRASTGPPAG
ncbi:MAG TPA: LacI family DNA-binding transcriptional regulator [Solirubrobacteraceae bacterium]|nr:LacI family DNA-binding transcriptional regulator [Solirubrobacteraceae bacterium]